MQAQEQVAVTLNGIPLTASSFLKKDAGADWDKDFFKVGSCYALPVNGRHGYRITVNFIYKGREVPETERGGESGKYIFQSQLSGEVRMFAGTELQRMEIEKFPEQDLKATNGHSILDQNTNVKYDGYDVPEGFFVVGKTYEVSSTRHAGDKRASDFPSAKKYVLKRIGQENRKYEGKYTFGLNSAPEKEIVFSTDELKNMRIERIVDEADVASTPVVERQIPKTPSAITTNPVIETPATTNEETPQRVEGAETVATGLDNGDIPMTHDNDTTPAPQLTTEAEQTEPKFFMPNKLGDDMSATFDGTAKLYQRARPFLQPDKVDATYALIDDLKGKVTNKAVLLLVTFAGTSETRQSNLRRTLKMSNVASTHTYICEQLALIASLADVSETSPHHEIFNYYCDFMQMDKSEILAEAQKLKQQAEIVPAESEPAVERETDVKKLMESVLATMTVEARVQQRGKIEFEGDRKNFARDYNHYGALLRMASGILNPEEFSLLSFYMRPIAMRPPQHPTKWVKLPDSIDAYRRGKTSEERRDMAYLAAIKVQCSDEYKKHSQDRSSSRNVDKCEACTLLRGIISDLSERVSWNIISVGSQMVRDAKATSRVVKPKAQQSPNKEGSEMTNPASQPISDVQAILADVLATIPAKYFATRETNKIVVAVLNPDEYSFLAFYLRPKYMFRNPRAGKEDTRVPLPESAVVHHAEPDISKKVAFSLLALQKVVASDAFAQAKASKNSDTLKACSMLDNLLTYLAGEVDKATLKKVAKEGDGSTPQAQEKRTRQAKQAAAPAPAEAVGAPTPVAVVATPAPSPSPAFNGVAGVVAEEKKHIEQFSPADGLIGYFSEVAGVRSKSLQLISMTQLRTQKIDPKQAAVNVGLDFEEAVVLFDHAVSKIRARAQEKGHQFVLDALENYKFE